MSTCMYSLDLGAGEGGHASAPHLHECAAGSALARLPLGIGPELFACVLKAFVFVVQCGTGSGLRWRETSWRKSITRSSSSCIMVRTAGVVCFDP